MERYKNLQGNSGIASYRIGRDSIIVAFRTGATYKYNYAVTGKEHIQNMKILAREGRGLSTYISRYVKDRYAEQLS
ncbi:hypothetical protein KK062_00080 [Fulvivirgaceae bacterium PWU5]|uniref:Uncharacterized protein n=1 Tax=Dawidia cretensis TaxID=2782350 RepID=A0AAP2DUN9_9BACT|nr:hypothetical protein [Dawidia cretensis]MBT1706593.1 hypothetical protein [Dawidia cretensis]